MLHFGRLFKVREGKVQQVRAWFTALSTERRAEAAATFAYEGVTREVFAMFKGADGCHYVVAFNEAEQPPKPGDPSVPINQEHKAVFKECLEPFSEKGEVLMDLSV